MQRIAVGHRADGADGQVIICHNAERTHAHVRLVYRRLIGAAGCTGECGGTGRAINHPDEEKSITFQRHPPSSLQRARARPVTCVRADT